MLGVDRWAQQRNPGEGEDGVVLSAASSLCLCNPLDKGASRAAMSVSEPCLRWSLGYGLDVYVLTLVLKIDCRRPNHLILWDSCWWRAGLSPQHSFLNIQSPHLLGNEDGSVFFPDTLPCQPPNTNTTPCLRIS